VTSEAGSRGSVPATLADGSLAAAGERALALLPRWFDLDRRRPGALPDELGDWWAVARRQPAPGVLELVRSDRRLRARLLARSDEEDLILLTEHRDEPPRPEPLAGALPITTRARPKSWRCSPKGAPTTASRTRWRSAATRSSGTSKASTGSSASTPGPPPRAWRSTRCATTSDSSAQRRCDALGALAMDLRDVERPRHAIDEGDLEHAAQPALGITSPVGLGRRAPRRALNSTSSSAKTAR
jgi:hypothetical protein